ncbi:MAG: hypothetical protein M3173_08215, partial [Chloroflexota bacterium]|nr:hypothetical protein [Chloroflexota bacterium]
MPKLSAPGGGRTTTVDSTGQAGPSTASGALPRLARLPYRNELLALLAIVLAVQLIGDKLTKGVYIQGVFNGAALALTAIPIVLIYRASKFVNFAQLALANIVGTLFIALVQGQFFLNTARSACGCIAEEPGGLARNINFVLAAVVAIAIAGLVSWAGYMSILQRFKRSPRIMLTLVTIFAGQALVGFEQPIEQFLLPDKDSNPDKFAAVAQRTTQPPGNFNWEIDPLASMRLGHLILILVTLATVIGLSVYLKRSSTGIAIRAAAENPSRAQTLGVDVMAVTSRVWLLAGVLAGVVGVVDAFGRTVESEAGVSTIPATTLAVLLAVAVTARFHNLAMAGLAAVVFSVLRLAVQFAYASTAPLDAVLVFIIGGLLLLQRPTGSRVERDDTAGEEVTREVRPIPREL